MPITLPSGAGTATQPATKGDTYMVCLDCGRHLAYDWGARFNSPDTGQKRPESPAAPGRSIEPEQTAPDRNPNAP